MPCLCWLIRWHTSPNSCDDKNRTPGTAVLVAEHDMLGSGVHCSMSCISLPGEVHDTLGGRQGLMSTTQGCASLHCCSESVHTHNACAGWQTGQLARWPISRPLTGQSAGQPADQPAVCVCVPIRYSGAARRNLGWRSSAPGAPLKYDAPHLAAKVMTRCNGYTAHCPACHAPPLAPLCQGFGY